MSRSPVPLDQLRVDEPCWRDWEGMSGDRRTRFCAGCGRHVHNVSAMTRDEVEHLICTQAGRLCVRFEQMPGGGVRTLDYAPATARHSWRYWTALGALGAVAAGAFNLFVMRKPAATTGVMVGMLPPMVTMPVPGVVGPPAPDADARICTIGPPPPAETVEVPVMVQGPPAPPDLPVASK
jgi:hypothetical protein